jgi:flagellar hook-associated protein 2
MAAINLSGFNGIDFNTILNAVMQSESQPLTALQTQQRSVQDKDAALASLAGIIGKLQTPAIALTSATAFSNVAASSTDTTVATVSLGDGGIAGEYDLSVTTLAKGQVTSSTSGFALPTTTAADGGSISFTINGQTTDAITISSATSLIDLKEQINTQNSGVVASIVNDGTDYKLVISSRATGTTNGFTINNSLTNSGGTAVTFAAGQSATSGNSQDSRNAAFTLNGMNISSSSNTVTSAVPGVTVTLLTEGSSTVKVTADYSSMKNNIKSLVTEYNGLRQFYAKQVKGPLGTDSVMRQALNDLKTVLLTRNENGGRYHYLAEIGLELTTTGDLKLDEAKLNTAIDSYPSDLQKLFQGTAGGNGALDEIKDALDNLDGSAGLIKSTRSNLDTSLKSIRDRIDSQNLRLEIRRQELVKMFTAADQAMSQLNAATSSLQSLQSRLF